MGPWRSSRNYQLRWQWLLVLGLLVLLSPVLLSAVGPGRSLRTILGEKLQFDLPETAVIRKTGDYYIECRTHYISGLQIEGTVDPTTFFQIKEGSEKAILYVEAKKAKFFGGDYVVLQDDSKSLVIIRHHAPSALTEVVTIDKSTGFGFDTKSQVISLNMSPKSDTYFLSCR
jgi:hypothetical protein